MIIGVKLIAYFEAVTSIIKHPLGLHSVIITFIIFHIEKTNDKSLR